MQVETYWSSTRTQRTNNTTLTLGAVEEILLVCSDPRGVLRLLGDAEERLERTDVGEGQLGKGIVLEICLGAHEEGCRVAGVTLGALSLALGAVDVPPRMAEREVPGFQSQQTVSVVVSSSAKRGFDFVY